MDPNNVALKDLTIVSPRRNGPMIRKSFFVSQFCGKGKVTIAIASVVFRRIRDYFIAHRLVSGLTGNNDQRRSTCF
jgi:hypothetical protein